MLKVIGKIAGYGLIFLAIVIGVSYLAFFRPMMKKMEVATKEIPQMLVQYHACRDGGLESNCDHFMSPNFFKGTSIADFYSYNKMISQKLGKRLGAELVKETMSVNQGLEGGHSFSFSMKAMYEKDPLVSEKYTILLNEDGNYLIHYIHMGSNLLIK